MDDTYYYITHEKMHLHNLKLEYRVNNNMNVTIAITLIS